MLRRSFFCLQFFLIGFFAQAQGESQLHIGVGSLSDFYPLNYNGKIYQATALGAGVRIGFEKEWKQLGSGHFNIGGIVSFGKSTGTYGIPGHRVQLTWTHVVCAARLVYVYPYNEDLNFYGGLHLGLDSKSYQEHYLGGIPSGTIQQSIGKLFPYGGMIVGADYKLGRHYAIYSELGYDLLWFTLGIKSYL
ncbi:MAG: hypothetical protein GC180_06350 [Bacteroidetes bacterium]|nr:hypothetical protein [Bacteroidota bacterium]